MSNVVHMSELYHKVKSFVDESLSLHPKRLKHSQGVSETAYKLALEHHIDLDSALIAGYLHDVTKKWNTDQHLLYMTQEDIALFDGFPFYYHGVSASKLASIQFGIDNHDMLQSMYFHSTGRSNMSKLEQIIFISDVCEPNRPWETKSLFKLACTDLNQATYVAAQFKYDDNIESNQQNHPLLIQTLTFYKETAWKK